MSDTDDTQRSSGGFFGDTTASRVANVGCLLFVIGIVVAISLPGFVRYEPRARQSEAKSALKAMYTSAKAWFGEKDTYPAHGGELFWVPARPNRYNYFVATEGEVIRGEALRAMSSGKLPPYATIQTDGVEYDDHKAFDRYAASGCPLTRAKHKDGTPASLGRSVSGDEEIFTAAAAGNVDRDAKLDCWSISTVDRVGPDGIRNPAGEPLHEQNDLEK